VLLRPRSLSWGDLRPSWRSFSAVARTLALVGASILPACGSAPAATFPPRPPLWRDDDRRPFEGKLKPYYSPHDWDRLEKSFVLPVSELLAVRRRGEAINVNALDEVPDSSWFENRLSRWPLSPDDLAGGPCVPPVLGSDEPWLVVGAKPDGASPGFVFEVAGQRYLAKVDGGNGSPRASVADVLGSRIYHAAGYLVPCYAIVHFDGRGLRIEAGAEAENEAGEEFPLTQAHLDAVLRKALRREDGRYRSVISVYLEGRPLGPWRYHDLRAGDRNDVVRHEDRRELRASRLLAAWTDHVDQREGNTLAMWRETDSAGRGYVMHHLLDFGDCFGSVWGVPAEEARRRGHDYWLDPRTILVDFLTLGVIERPWERATLGPWGFWLGYYDVDSFDPEAWRPRYPNPAFVRMTEHDAAWMARIIARLGPRHIERMLDEAMAPPAYRQALQTIVLGRRDKILRRYLLRLSPLADPSIGAGPGGHWLCATDLSVSVGIAGPRSHWARFLTDEGTIAATVRSETAERPCVLLPEPKLAREAGPRAVIVEMGSRVPPEERRSAASNPAPVRFHLYALGAGKWLLAGVERSDA
jgi:hypothetical protein